MVWPWIYHSSHESHRDGCDEEVPGEEGAQPEDKADPDQVVAVRIRQKVLRRTSPLAASASQTNTLPPRRSESELQPHHPGSSTRGGGWPASSNWSSLRFGESPNGAALLCPRPPDPHTPHRTWSPTCLSRGASPRAMAAWQDRPSGRKRRAPHLSLPGARGPSRGPGRLGLAGGGHRKRGRVFHGPRPGSGRRKLGKEAPPVLLVSSTAGSDLGSAPPGRGRWGPHPSRPPRTRDSRLQPTRGLTSWSPDSTAPRASREGCDPGRFPPNLRAPGPDMRAGGGR